jgi:hypothetical protein
MASAAQTLACASAGATLVLKSESQSGHDGTMASIARRADLTVAADIAALRTAANVAMMWGRALAGLQLERSRIIHYCDQRVSVC